MIILGRSNQFLKNKRAVLRLSIRFQFAANAPNFAFISVFVIKTYKDSIQFRIKGFDFLHF